MAPNFNSCTSGIFLYFPPIKLLKKTLILLLDIIIYQAFSIKKFIYYSEIIIIQLFIILGLQRLRTSELFQICISIQPVARLTTW